MSRTRGIVSFRCGRLGGRGRWGRGRRPLRRAVPSFVAAPAFMTVAVVMVVAHCVDGKTVPKNGAQSQQRDSYPASHVVLLQQPAAQPDSKEDDMRRWIRITLLALGTVLGYGF